MAHLEQEKRIGLRRRDTNWHRARIMTRLSKISPRSKSRRLQERMDKHGALSACVAFIQRMAMRISLKDFDQNRSSVRCFLLCATVSSRVFAMMRRSVQIKS